MDRSQVLDDLSARSYSICPHGQQLTLPYLELLRQIVSEREQPHQFKYGLLLFAKFSGEHQHAMDMGFMFEHELDPIFKQGKVVDYYIACVYEKRRFCIQKSELAKLIQSDPKWPRMRFKEPILRVATSAQQETNKEDQGPALQRVRDMKIKHSNIPTAQTKMNPQKLGKVTRDRKLKVETVQQEGKVSPKSLNQPTNLEQDDCIFKKDQQTQQQAGNQFKSEEEIPTSVKVQQDTEDDDSLNDLLKRQKQRQASSAPLESLKVEQNTLPKEPPTRTKADSSWMKPASKSQATLGNYFAKKK